MKALGPVDQLFLFLERRQQPMHVAGLQLFSYPEPLSSAFFSRGQYSQTAAPITFKGRRWLGRDRTYGYGGAPGAHPTNIVSHQVKVHLKQLHSHAS